MIHLPILPFTLVTTSSSDLVRGRVTFRFAAKRGFCGGVERALRLAGEATASASPGRVFLTSPILHNPAVNEDLRRKGVRFLSEDEDLWRGLGADDVVILPAFGAVPEICERVKALGCKLVDTTCGSVVFVWKQVEKLAEGGFTVLYHGRRGHEETVATLERCRRRGKGREVAPYVLLQSIEDAKRVADFFQGRLDGQSLLASLAETSPGLDPDRDLRRVGFASQTTMLATETTRIEDLLRSAHAARQDRVASDRGDFAAQPTLCRATQERQDALQELLASKVDVVIVVGGYDSSNSGHLCQQADDVLPAFHVEGPQDVLGPDTIRHRSPRDGSIVTTRRWLPPGPVTVGVTSGASTPEFVLEAVVERVASLA